MTPVDCFVSVVVPLRNDAEIVGGFVADTIGLLRAHYTNYELVLVDDASRDDTVAQVTALLASWECVRLIPLSRHCGVDVAIAAGLDSVIGDVVVVMLPRTDPVALIPDMVRHIQSTADVVFGTIAPPYTGRVGMRVGAALFYAYCRRVLQLQLPPHAAIFRALSRQAVNALTRIGDRCRYLPLLCAQIGFESRSFEYVPISRGSRRARSLSDAVRLGIEIVTSASSHPLRFVTWLGMMASVVNGCYALYVVAIYLFKQQVAEGWTTLSLQSAAMFFFVFLILTVLSEYVGQILAQLEHRPLYNALDERTSTTALASERRLNVMHRVDSERA